MMKISSLIKLRENNRDRQRLELLDAEARESALRKRIGKLDEQLRLNLEKWRQAEARQPVPLDDLRLIEAQRRELFRLRDEAARELALAADQTNAARGRLGEAVRDVRVLENLRDRQESQAAAAEKKTEQKKFREDHLCK